MMQQEGPVLRLEDPFQPIWGNLPGGTGIFILITGQGGVESRRAAATVGVVVGVGRIVLVPFEVEDGRVDTAAGSICTQ